MAYDIGNITESDIKTVIATKAQVFGFRVGVEPSAHKLAEKEGIELRTHDIIYELIAAIRKSMADLLDPEVKKLLLGKLKVLAIFKQDSKYQIVGGRVMDGKIVRGMKVDLVQNGVSVLVGKLGQLQQNKEDVIEVKEGNEAGLRIDAADLKVSVVIKEGDILEVYEEESIERTI